MNSFDIVSDLHIDQWDRRIPPNYPCGPVSQYPLKWSGLARSRFLIVAGDVSDDISRSLNYLKYLTNFYEKVLFIDGNHEHVDKYPYLYSTKEIFDKINNEKLIYLPRKDFILGETVILGYCGWWDYLEGTEIINNYFENWIPHFTKDENIVFANEVLKRGENEFEHLRSKLETYQEDSKIKNIIIVTHSIPNENFSSEREGTELNKKFKLLNKDKYSKISKWIFGHVHTENEKEIDGILMISNPRGRPEDYNRKEYSPKQIIVQENY